MAFAEAPARSCARSSTRLPTAWPDRRCQPRGWADPPLLARRLEAVLTVDGPAAGRHEWYLRQLPAVAADHVVHDAARLVRCRALRRAERLSHHWHPARLEGNAPLLPEFPAAEGFAAGGAIPSARGLRALHRGLAKCCPFSGYSSKASWSVDPCSVDLPRASLLWLQDCDRLALGASHSDQNVYEALDSKQLAEVDTLISRRWDGNHLALSSHERWRLGCRRHG